MTTNYDVSGTDLEDIFQIYYSKQASTTNYSVNGSDLNTFFEKIGGGTTADTTNYIARFTTTVDGIGTVYDDVDLNTVFAGKTYTITNSSTYAEVVNTDSTKYIVLCFGSKTSNTSSILNYITFNTTTTVNYWIVGGGGGGGGTISTSATGAGGGGGGSIVTGSFTPSLNTSYMVVSGKGGGGKSKNNDGSDGDPSYIIKTENVLSSNMVYVGYAAGGNGGYCAANGGTGGAVASYNGTTNIGKGGTGATILVAATDGNDGKNMSSVVSITLSDYGPRFSGGGGGGGTSTSAYRIGGTGGGSGIGGDGGDYASSGNLAQNGTMMTGSGGGGGAKPYTGDSYRQGGDGGSGAVILWFTYY